MEVIKGDMTERSLIKGVLFAYRFKTKLFRQTKSL